MTLHPSQLADRQFYASQREQCVALANEHAAAAFDAATDNAPESLRLHLKRWNAYSEAVTYWQSRIDAIEQAAA